eukprot:gene8500-9370_t
MLALYYFQGELGESLDTPNAFMLPGNSGSSITLKQFLDAFPYPIDRNNTFLRFRVPDEQLDYAWLDISDPAASLPVYEGVIFVKILRLDPAVQAKRKLFLRRKAVQQSSGSEEKVKFVRPPPASSAPPVSTSSATPAGASVSQSGGSGKMSPANSSSGSRASAPPINVPSTSSGTNNGVGIAANGSGISPKPSSSSSRPPARPSVSVPPAAAAKAVPSLLDDDDLMSSPLHAGSPSVPSTNSAKISSFSPKSSFHNNSSSVNDIDEGPARPYPSATSAFSSGSAMPESSLNREELAAKKDEAISDKVKAALDFKKEMDLKAFKEREDFDAAREKHDKALINWATTNGGKDKRNVRTLLSTMHNVLPPGSKWKALGLGDVLQASDVKKAYRKAMLVVHPDHTVSLDPESKFICKRIFEALNEAYDDFSKKENP